MVIPILHIEVVLKETSQISKKSIISLVQQFLENSKTLQTTTILTSFNSEQHPILHSDVKAIVIEDVRKEYRNKLGFIDINDYNLKWYVYSLNNFGPMQHCESDGEDGELNIATHLTLPSADLYNLWENLYYDNNIKENLLEYAQTMMEFSDKGVDSNIIGCNRVILLHGPPGTGKTSLCKALAQKLMIRMDERYHSGLLIEINSHSLFSKWFSESAKLVTIMFTKIKEIVDNKNILICVLIDEVESVAHARNQCISGNEPSDSIRVVNAILTQIDQIKRHSNVLILATSNMTEAIDLAFIDRADIKQFLGLPSVPAIYKIYYSCIVELQKSGIICNNKCVESVEVAFSMEDSNENNKHLIQICEKSVGLSGRSLRKIPFIAHALFVNKLQTFVGLNDYLEAMEKAVNREHGERKYFEHYKQTVLIKQ